MRRAKHVFNPRKGNRPINTEDLAVECWCRTEIIHVNVKVIARCETDTCGRSWCHAPS